MRFLPTSAALLGMLVPAWGQSNARLLWQPVQEYFIRIQPGKEQVNVTGTKRLNSFTAYTHLGTDFGFHGPAEYDISWQSDEICVNLGQEPDCWAGLWHSLSGLAREPGKTLNFAAAWPDFIAARYQPRISSIRLDVSGRGRIKLEIKAEGGRTLWTHLLEVQTETMRPRVMALDPNSLPAAKLVNWTVEPGSEICVSGLYLGLEAPDVPFEEYVLAASYAKLARCHSRADGFVRDRAHLEDGAFESVASTGLFALATAAAAAEPYKLVSKEFAARTIREIHLAGKALDRPLGLLPHFVRRCATGHMIHPGTEFSTVDTAIFYHSLLLAARILEDESLAKEVLTAVEQIDFAKLRLPSGVLSHGIKEDSRTLLPHGWEDWGGETALVMMLERIANPNAPRHKMDRPGQAWQGTGFIPELQSLFYPDFDSDVPDALDGVKWLTARQRMLAAQKDYIQRTWKGSQAARLGVYGLSAGEGEHGDRYHVGGVDLPDQAVIHPHYILMSAALTRPGEVYPLLRRMERAGYFPPWGMVETISVTSNGYLPMAGSLNAGFEALGAYHALTLAQQQTNAVFSASRGTPELRRAVELFYPTAQPPEVPKATQPVFSPKPASVEATTVTAELHPQPGLQREMSGRQGSVGGQGEDPPPETKKLP